PDVPAQVRGPGTTPIGTDPGPAQEPVDTPTGCRGSCDPAPAVTVPPSGPGSPTGTPGSGTSGNGEPLPTGGSSGVSDPEPAGIPTTSVPPAGDPGGF